MAYRLQPAGVKTEYGDKFEFYSVVPPSPQCDAWQRQLRCSCQPQCPPKRIECMPRPPGRPCYLPCRPPCEQEIRCHRGQSEILQNICCEQPKCCQQRQPKCCQQRQPKCCQQKQPKCCLQKKPKCCLQKQPKCCEQKQPKCCEQPHSSSVDPGTCFPVKKACGCCTSQTRGQAQRQCCAVHAQPIKCPSAPRDCTISKLPFCPGKKIVCHL